MVLYEKIKKFGRQILHGRAGRDFLYKAGKGIMDMKHKAYKSIRDASNVDIRLE
jgi:hypothetical protein